MAKGGSGLAAPDWQARRSSVNAGASLMLSPQAAAGRVLGIQRKLHKWASDEQLQFLFKDDHRHARGEPDAGELARPVRRAAASRPPRATAA
jgi:hypothetical protein